MFGNILENTISNYQNNEYNIHLEQHKLQLDKLDGLQDEIYSFLSMLERECAYPDEDTPGFSELYNKIDSIIMSYGSVDSIKILTEIRNRVNLALSNKLDLPTSDLIALFVLLATQIKYDVTNVKTSPDLWYIARDYKSVEMNFNNFYTDSVDFINKTIGRLQLKNIPKIKKTPLV